MIKNIVSGQTGTDHRSKFASPSLTFSSYWVFYIFLCNINLASGKILWRDTGSELRQKFLPFYHTERKMDDDNDDDDDDDDDDVIVSCSCEIYRVILNYCWGFRGL
jgi:hypothetical protein